MTKSWSFLTAVRKRNKHFPGPGESWGITQVSAVQDRTTSLGRFCEEAMLFSSTSINVHSNYMSTSLHFAKNFTFLACHHAIPHLYIFCPQLRNGCVGVWWWGYGLGGGDRMIILCHALDAKKLKTAQKSNLTRFRVRAAPKSWSKYTTINLTTILKLS